jgi:hypothetical protein
MLDWSKIAILSVIAAGAGTFGGFSVGFGTRAVYDLSLPAGELSLVSSLASGVLLAVLGLGVGVAASAGAIVTVALFGRKLRLRPFSRSLLASCGGGLASLGLLSFVYRDPSYVTEWWTLPWIAALVSAVAFVVVYLFCRSSRRVPGFHPRAKA